MLPTLAVIVARLSAAGTFPLDQVEVGKQKFLEQVVTHVSKKKPPLSKQRKQMRSPDEGVKQSKRRQGGSLVRRNTRRLEPPARNGGVHIHHIHVNLDGSSQVQTFQDSSPQKIMMIVSPAKTQTRARRSLEVSTPSSLDPISEGSGLEEEPLCNGNAAHDGVGKPSAIDDLPKVPYESPVLAIQKPLLLGVDTSSSRPLSPGVCNQLESWVGVPYIVDIASNGDGRGPGEGCAIERDPAQHTIPCKQSNSESREFHTPLMQSKVASTVARRGS